MVSDSSICTENKTISRQDDLSDTVIKPLRVEAEGAPREYTVSDLICIGGDCNIANLIFDE